MNFLFIKRGHSTVGLVSFMLVALASGWSAHAADKPVFIDVSEKAKAAVKQDPPVFDKKLAHIMSMVAAGASGGGIGDYNNDGFLDIFVNNPQAGKANYLLRNNGDFTFTDVAQRAGVANLNDENEVSTMGLFFDYDGDRWQDLLVVRFGQTKLFRNKQDGTFEDVTDIAGLTRKVNALAAVVFDVNHDGYLDIYLGSYFRDFNMFQIGAAQSEVLHDSWETSRNGGANVLYVNQGNGRFKDNTKISGTTDSGWTMAVGHSDFDGDGHQDIYVANDFGRDVIFKNNGKGQFTDVSESAIGVDTKKGMNAETGDFDNDGDMDVFVTNVTEEFLMECNMLWQNNGAGQFVDVSQEWNVCDTGWGWAGKFFDYNNDGYLDLYVANGFFTGQGKGDYLEVLLPAIWDSGEDPSNPKVWPPTNGMGIAGSEPNVLFTNTSGKSFNREIDSGLEIKKDSRAVFTADFDNDGRVDIFITNNDDKTSLFRNTTTSNNNWVQVKLRGKASNTDAIGAKITLTAGDLTMMREVNMGNGFGGGSMTRQHFGLGKHKTINRIEIVWPNGDKQQFADLAINQMLTFDQSAGSTDGARVTMNKSEGIK